MELGGTPSDEVPEILATGRSGIGRLWVSMCARDPEGRDEAFLRWHTFDHRPEQHRLASLRAALRLVSTPACRAARVAGDTRYDPIDHVMTYFFADMAGLQGFSDLSVALRGVGRTTYTMPPVERAVCELAAIAAAPRIKVGADVIPWWPMQGAYVLVERGDVAPATDLTEIDGIGGVWSTVTIPAEPIYTNAETGLQITFCYLDDDPVAVADRLRPAVEKRASATGVELRFAAPFHTVTPETVGRYLPWLPRPATRRDVGGPR